MIVVEGPSNTAMYMDQRRRQAPAIAAAADIGIAAAFEPYTCTDVPPGSNNYPIWRYSWALRGCLSRLLPKKAPTRSPWVSPNRIVVAGP